MSESQIYSLNQYRNEIRAIPRLTEAQEAAINDRILAGDDTARSELVLHNLQLPAALAAKYAGHGLDISDLIQKGNIGLMLAAEKYTPSEGRFTTYAVWWIKHSIIRAIEESGRVVRIPSYLTTAAIKYSRFASDFMRDNGRKPTDNEAAFWLNMSIDKIRCIKLYRNSAMSLDSPIDSTNEELTLADTIESKDDTISELLDNIELQELHEDLERLIDKLSVQESKTVRGIYYRKRTIKQLAEELNVSENEVRKYSMTAMRELRRPEAARVLRKYTGSLIDQYGYRGSFSVWKRTGSSSTEFAALKLIDLEKELYENESKQA
ncbi:MAG: sigma-70 family RNA polymerase sigma factor [Clostridiales bacterium]|nr:sigma-70 family RNA polymerase sigma factor [Clostridiales bacterium]